MMKYKNWMLLIFALIVATFVAFSPKIATWGLLDPEPLIKDKHLTENSSSDDSGRSIIIQNNILPDISEDEAEHLLVLDPNRNKGFWISIAPNWLNGKPLGYLKTYWVGETSFEVCVLPP